MQLRHNTKLHVSVYYNPLIRSEQNVKIKYCTEKFIKHVSYDIIIIIFQGALQKGGVERQLQNYFNFDHASQIFQMPHKRSVLAVY